MEKHCCSFLENSFSDINEETLFCEKHLVNENYIDSIFRAGKAAEYIVKEICEFEKLYSLKRESQSTIVYTLKNKKIIPREIFLDFQDIRIHRNTNVHDRLFDRKTKAFEIHKEIFEISAFFYKKYRDNDYVAPDYNGPIMQKTEISPGEEIKKVIGPLKNYPFEKYKGSYLYNELYKLSDSSNEAVDSDELSYFKNYLHVDRSIQKQFIQEVNRIENLDSSHLIILSGSTGDGKSHLLACLKSEKPDLYDNFTVIRDATESFDPNKDDIDNLAAQLTPFNDKNISKSTEKIILLINLGVLSNFLNSDYSNYTENGENYSELKRILIDDYKIFDSDLISHNIFSEKVSFLTFVDYNCFELNDNPNENFSSSNFISSLFEKITDTSEENPIHAAYQKDKQEGYNSPLIYNYEMFMDVDVQNTLIRYLIKIFVKHKLIVSTRDILNFIYEILVPLENLSKTSLEQNITFIDNLLPNLLFNTGGRSKLLKLFKEFDPILQRNAYLDDFITDLNINKDIDKVLEYFNMGKLEFLREILEQVELNPISLRRRLEQLELNPISLREILEQIGLNPNCLREISEQVELNLNSVKTDEKDKIILHRYSNFFVRLSLFYGNSNIRQGFNDEIYTAFMKYLYFCHNGNKDEYQNLFNEINSAIFKYKGSNKRDFICIDELASFKVFKRLKLKSSYQNQSNDLEDDVNRFKDSITISSYVSGSDENVLLDVDYSLYSYIKKLNSGFKPNKSDKEDLRLLDEFISTLVLKEENDYLIVNSLKTDYDFEFEFDDGFKTYNFRRI